MDGRKAGDPFAVHISPLSSEIDIAEIMDFATKLNYEDNRINGNVVDFTIPASYIQSPTKLENLIKNACNRGIFELQLNVLNYKQLVDAKLHPEKYPNLIVRVWGFSAYFNDLPNEYKDNLIERAKLYEWS
ncbi:glycine radical domain-containing protein [Bacteroides hominis]|uniref:glycine radical domain-containing protein n=1 Tax=Bacteroides hominis TaxID=2763023 RepID=UPI003D6CFF7F